MTAIGSTMKRTEVNVTSANCGKCPIADQVARGATAAANASSASRSEGAIAESSTSSVARSAPRGTSIVAHASPTIDADIVDRISSSWARAYAARDDAITTATGFPGNSSEPTSQSSAFLNDPGSPCAYSGV